MVNQVTKETETHKIRQDSNIVQRIIYTVSGAILAVLALRFVFKILGANSDNGFTSGIYAFTQPIVGIFEGIFSSSTINGAEMAAGFEPATLIAMVVIALITWAVLKLITPHRGNRLEETQYTKQSKLE